MRTEAHLLDTSSTASREEYNREYRKRNLARLRHYNLWNNCRQRAKAKGLEFSLTEDDIVVPDKCPILGIPIMSGFQTGRDNSPSVDRIRLTEGYIPSNIQVISYLANRMKNNATLEQLVLLGEWAKKILQET